MTLSQPQREAFADILVLAMCIDGHFSLLEEKEIQAKVSDMGWDENLSPQLHLAGSISRAREVAASADDVRAYLNDLAPLLREPALAKLVFESAVSVLDVDGNEPEEGTFMAQLKAALLL